MCLNFRPFYCIYYFIDSGLGRRSLRYRKSEF